MSLAKISLLFSTRRPTFAMIRPRVGAGNFAQPFCAFLAVRSTVNISVAELSGTVAITSFISVGLVEVNMGSFSLR
ncbi:unannotated protein [freshwater metagenome]|uniref:Unannotated protein n=1 Tax=freshwater metagenome TaxID=449393 RepID=A0A6J6KU35_9ZZZZ